MNLESQMSKIIAQTNDKRAPTVLMDAHTAIDKLGFLLARIDEVKQSQVAAYMQALMSYWPDDSECEAIVGTPEFILALSAMLCESIRDYVRKA